MLRSARESDAAQVRRIFLPVVEKTAISFATACPTEDELRAKIRDTLPVLPWLVEEEDGRLAGYAYASKHRTLGAYRWSVELSVYVDEGARRRGTARRLYGALLAELKARGYCNAYAGITLPNEASVRLHEDLGFKPFCVFRSVGWKLGRWHDVGWWELSLQGGHPSPPPEPRAP